MLYADAFAHRLLTLRGEEDGVLICHYINTKVGKLESWKVGGQSFSNLDYKKVGKLVGYIFLSIIIHSIHFVYLLLY